MDVIKHKSSKSGTGNKPDCGYSDSRSAAPLPKKEGQPQDDRCSFSVDFFGSQRRRRGPDKCF
jgi:hypothetical protein